MGNIRVVADIAALRAVPLHHQDQIAKVKSTGDDYWFDATSSTDDDGFLFVKPTDTLSTAAGRWRLFE